MRESRAESSPTIFSSMKQDEFSRLSRNASLGVDGYALVFSIVSRQSFDRIKDVNDALLNALGDAPDVPRVLVGSMRDLADKRVISFQVGPNKCAPRLGRRCAAHMLLQTIGRR